MNIAHSQIHILFCLSSVVTIICTEKTIEARLHHVLSFYALTSSVLSSSEVAQIPNG